MFKRLGIVVVCLIAAVHPLEGKAAEPARAIRDVTISKSFFNPALRQTIDLSFRTTQEGSVSVLIVDRDGFPIRKLMHESRLAPGLHSAWWDGRNDSGAIVADEAYTLKIDLKAGKQAHSYFPANNAAHATHSALRAEYYDRQNGIIAYKLPAASRVHIQAASAVVDPKTNLPDGAVLRTIANREPRIAGSIVEHWNGFDESGTIFVPELPNFVLAIAAEPLVENAIITKGNRKQSFLQYAENRAGQTLFNKPTAASHHHHAGLTALDDVSPQLQMTLDRGIWSPKTRSWEIERKNLNIDVSLSGLSAPYFSRQPGKLFIFIDGKKVQELVAPLGKTSTAVTLRNVPSGTHYVAVNWASAYGPTAAHSLRFIAQ